MRRIFEVLLVMLVVAVAARLWPHPAGTTSVDKVLIHGLASGDTRQRAEFLLGKPSCQGPLQVGQASDEAGSYAEWGGSSHLTWNGSPTVTFWPDGRILATIGNVLSAGQRELSLGSTEQEVLEALGPATSSEGASVTYEAPGVRLHLSYTKERKLARILRESLREPTS